MGVEATEVPYINYIDNDVKIAAKFIIKLYLVVNLATKESRYLWGYR